jgi:curved DNA-binding protein CbpA
MNPDPYRVLGVPSTASQTQIAHAYRARVRAHHPDTRSPQGSAVADEWLQQVLAAYALLRDPARRADYDQCAADRTMTPRRVRIVPTSTDSAHTGRVEVPIIHRYDMAPSPDLWVGPVRRYRPRTHTENPSA